MKNEFKILLTAFLFYTRIPVPRIPGYTDEWLNRATKYFPFIGWVVGGTSALLFWGLHLILPVSLALLVSIIGSIFLTGAFHEDGFADFCDGMGGGMTRERILTIMKDSRIGTYGTTGLVMILAVKFTALLQLPPSDIPLILLAGHTVSRFVSVLLIHTAQYSREDATSKSKPIGLKGKNSDLLVALLFCLPFAYFITWQIWVFFIPLMALIFIRFRQYIRKKLGGYTGDILGALQQISEIVFYVSALLFYQNQWL